MSGQLRQIIKEKEQLYSELASTTREGIELTAQVRGLNQQVLEQRTHGAHQEKVTPPFLKRVQGGFISARHCVPPHCS